MNRQGGKAQAAAIKLREVRRDRSYYARPPLPAALGCRGNGRLLCRALTFFKKKPGRRSAVELLVPRRGFETFGKFASSSLSVAITAFDLFLHVFKYSLTDGARKPRRPQNPTNGAGFQTGTLMTGLKNAPSRARRQSERRSLLI